MPKQAKPRPDVRFLLDTDKDNYSTNPYVTAKLTCHVMGWTDDKMRQELLYPGHFYRDDPNYTTNCLADLTVSSQASMVSPDSDTRADWYGWSTEFYRPFAVDLERAKDMAAVLTKVKRGLDRHEAEFGRPESFPAYALLVARLAGATETNCFGFRSTSGRQSYDGSPFRWGSVETLRYELQDTATGKITTTTRH